MKCHREPWLVERGTSSVAGKSLYRRECKIVYFRENMSNMHFLQMQAETLVSPAGIPRYQESI
ncbi:MAG: hypothetical protein IJD02_00110 [Lachnospiraceae bacterium]|nr:hypothetical protein [Lachnospiraceae bacterium]